jgi:membrane protein DedA with SNARE-associated domain
MSHWKFSLFTLAGAALWVTVLTWIGYLIGENQALVMEYSKQAVVGGLALSTIILIVYIWRHWRNPR